MTNEEVRIASGEFKSTDPLTLLFYLLMRDKLPAGEVEQIIMDMEKSLAKNESVEYTNGWLAQYAFNLSSRIDDLFDEDEESDDSEEISSDDWNIEPENDVLD